MSFQNSSFRSDKVRRKPKLSCTNHKDFVRKTVATNFKCSKYKVKIECFIHTQNRTANNWIFIVLAHCKFEIQWRESIFLRLLDHHLNLKHQPYAPVMEKALQLKKLMPLSHLAMDSALLFISSVLH